MFKRSKFIEEVEKCHYLENISFPTSRGIDFSIGKALQNSSGINLTKITENAGARTEMSLSTSPLEKPKSVSMWKDFGFFGREICEFNIEKVNMPENTLFYVNQGYQSYKDNKKVYYNIFITAQIIPLAHQPKDIENYELKDDEVKILRSRYDPVSGEFLGIEYCIGVITVRNDPEEQFFDYGYIQKIIQKYYIQRKKLKFRAVLSPQFLEFTKINMKEVLFLMNCLLEYFFIYLSLLIEMKKL